MNLLFDRKGTLRPFVNRLERWLWYALLLTLPWQTRVLFWQDGLRFSEWQSMAFWLTDGLLVGLLVLGLFRSCAWLRQGDRVDAVLAIFVATVFLSIWQASSYAIAWYAAARLTVLALFFKYLRGALFRRINPDYSAVAFVAGALVQAVLGLAQYILQRDVGIRWMGETFLRTDMRGVAVFFDTAGEKILRAYGALPHPNVLALYLLAAVWVLAWLYLRHGGHRRRWIAVLWACSGGILLAALYVTYARTVILAGVLAAAVVVWAVYRQSLSRKWPYIAIVRRRLMRGMLFTAAVCGMLVVITWPQTLARLQLSSDDEAVQLRVRYAGDALGTGAGWLALNWTGVGAGNFVPWMMATQPHTPPHLYQPTHNVYLLAYAEIGLLGLTALLVWLGVLLRYMWRTWASQPFLRVGLAVFVGAMLLVAFWDHFFWTLQQGRLLWWLALAVAAGVPVDGRKKLTKSE